MHTIETIRLSEKQKQQLTILKRRTGIANWNILCRKALCMSLAEKTVPALEDIPSDSSVEMNWKVFAGEYADVYLVILRQAHQRQSKQLEEINFSDFIKLHFNRGISFYLKA